MRTRSQRFICPAWRFPITRSPTTRPKRTMAVRAAIAMRKRTKAWLMACGSSRQAQRAEMAARAIDAGFFGNDADRAVDLQNGHAHLIQLGEAVLAQGSHYLLSRDALFPHPVGQQLAVIDDEHGAPDEGVLQPGRVLH